MQVVVRALAVLRALAPCPGGLSLAMLSEQLGVPTGSMHRMLAVLEREQFVTRSPSNRRYFLGPAARQLAEENATRQAALVTPHPALTEAAAASGETVFITELVGDRAVCVALVESRRPLRMFVRIGQDMPLHAASSARTLLAYRDPEEARLLLAGRPLTAYTDETPTTLDAVIEHLVIIRARGYDLCDDELDRGVWAVAAPVRASTGRVVASVALAAPSHRVATAGQRAAARAVVCDAAAAMAADLGWPGPADATEPLRGEGRTVRPAAPDTEGMVR
jgi:IclR family acetate operon transcriptional repressor